MKVGIMICLLSVLSLFANDSYIKALAKNRASKGIAGSNYKVINGEKDFFKAQKNGKTIGIKEKKKKVGLIINYVEVKNVKLKEKKEKRKYGLAKIKNEQTKNRLYGVKVNKNFKGKVYNKVIVKNSNLN